MRRIAIAGLGRDRPNLLITNPTGRAPGRPDRPLCKADGVRERHLGGGAAIPHERLVGGGADESRPRSQPGSVMAAGLSAAGRADRPALPAAGAMPCITMIDSKTPAKHLKFPTRSRCQGQCSSKLPPEPQSQGRSGRRRLPRREASLCIAPEREARQAAVDRGIRA